MPSVSIASAHSFGGLAKRVNIDLNDVPACSPLIPALAISPIAVATSSTEYFSAPARGAAYLKVAPIIDTFVLLLDDAAARTSAKCAESFACKPNAVKASVTISETLARSSPDAAAMFMIPSIPDIISADFQPAIAIYCIASADSVALNFVFAPISLAFSVKASSSFPDVPEIAATFDIPSSKSAPTFIA